MTRRRGATAAITALMLAATLDGRGVSRASATPPPSGPPPKVFAFVSGLGGGELRRLNTVGARIDVIAPNWYALRAGSGRLRGPSRPGPLRDAAQRLGIAVWPTVNARTHGAGTWTSARARERIVAALLEVARAPGAAGVTLDMEELRADQRPAFTALVAEAATALHQAGRALAVYVPRPGPGSRAAYDWGPIAHVSDLLLCAGYNEHWSGSGPGPITTSAGFATVLEAALTHAGAAKAVPVLGAFGYRWSRRGSGRLISTEHARHLRRRRHAAPTRSDGAEHYRLGGDTVVFETVAGLRARAAAARAAGARWIGLFSLGREPIEFWTALATARQGTDSAGAAG